MTKPNLKEMLELNSLESLISKLNNIGNNASPAQLEKPVIFIGLKSCGDLCTNATIQEDDGCYVILGF